MWTVFAVTSPLDRRGDEQRRVAADRAAGHGPREFMGAVHQLEIRNPHPQHSVGVHDLADRNFAHLLDGHRGIRPYGTMRRVVVAQLVGPR
jgi:hypothetical protein